MLRGLTWEVVGDDEARGNFCSQFSNFGPDKSKEQAGKLDSRGCGLKAVRAYRGIHDIELYAERSGEQHMHKLTRLSFHMTTHQLPQHKNANCATMQSL